MKQSLPGIGANSTDLLRRLIAVLMLFGGLLTFGTLGYMILEGWAWYDAFYMTVITLSTVGFGEVRSLDQGGRIFTMILIVLGVGGAAYTFSTVADYIVAGELRGILRRRRMEQIIKQLQNHYIVCGYGRVGSQVVQELRQNQVSMVVIEANPDLSTEIEEMGIVSVIGNASEDAMLSQAGIERAAGLCACLPNDADNVFVTLTARTLNPHLTIIARANTQENERKLRIAGADHVINPYSISGHRMARQLIHPNVVEFMDVVMRRGQVEMRIEEIRVHAGSNLCNKSIAECDVRRRTGTNVLAIRRPSGQTQTVLSGDIVLTAGDTLIGLGTPEQLDALAALADDGR
ncbi:MAG: potassium channel protein [Caldilineaceae bacterium]|nr:potassium channel protein [Caldilineaceae bacterium]